MPKHPSSSTPQTLLIGFGSFVAFEVVAFWLLRWLTTSLGQPDHIHADTTIVSNWLQTVAFVVLHLALVLGAMLALSNRLPRQYHGQLMGWFYAGLLMSFLLLAVLFS